MRIRAEKENDRGAVYQINAAAFERRIHHGWRYVVKYHVAFSNV